MRLKNEGFIQLLAYLIWQQEGFVVFITKEGGVVQL